MAAEISLAELLGDAARRVPEAPELDSVIEDTGRQRLATYYLYTALISGMIDDDAIAPSGWPPQLAEPMNRLGLGVFAPRTERALDTELTPAEQSARRSPGRQFEFAQLTADLINQGAFGAVCGEADSVRLSDATDRRGYDLELLAGNTVVGKCRAEDHWELVAQQLAGAPHGDDPLADRASAHTFATKVAKRLKESGISQAVSRTTDLAVGVSPLGTAVGVGTRLVRSRIRTGHDEADALHKLGAALRTIRAEAEGELSRTRLNR
jgi:hypothetical protein